MISAGNSFSPSAPAFSAAKPSDGVITPGSDASPAAFAARTTSASKFGATTSLPPASFTRATSAASSTVPAPTSAWCAWRPASRLMLSNGCGELSGTSMTVTPASISASPMASISSGFTPRRIATIGQ